MIKRMAALARGIGEDPVVMGMVGLFLLGRCLDGLTERAGQLSERLGQVQEQAQKTLADGLEFAAQAAAATSAARQQQRATSNGAQAQAEAPAEAPERAD